MHRAPGYLRKMQGAKAVLSNGAKEGFPGWRDGQIHPWCRRAGLDTVKNGTRSHRNLWLDWLDLRAREASGRDDKFRRGAMGLGGTQPCPGERRIGRKPPVDPLPFDKPANQRNLMKQSLTGKKVAILVTDGFEQSELVKPRDALEKAGAETDLIAPDQKRVRAWDEDNFGETFDVNVQLADAHAETYDALLLPGGVMSPDKLRMIPAAVQFVSHFFVMGKPVAAICHGPQLLIEADVVRGRRLTSYPSLKTDLRNAGAEWVDEPVVTDQGLVTSRRPDDIPMFNEKMIEEIVEGYHAGQKRSSAGEFSRSR